MKTIRQPAQQQLFDPFEGVIGPMGREMIAGGRQGLFREVLLEQLPVNLVGEDHSDDSGRSTHELHAIIVLSLIREFQRLAVPAQIHEALLFRRDIRYALNLQPSPSERSSATSHGCRKTRPADSSFKCNKLE